MPTLSFKSNLMQSINSKVNNDNEMLDENETLINRSALKLTKLSVKRALFVEKHEIDHEANLKLVRKQMEQIEQQDCEKWNFDFKNNRPLNCLNGRYEWYSVNSIVLNKLDPLYTKRTIEHTSSSHSINKLSNINNCDQKIDTESFVSSQSSNTSSNLTTSSSSGSLKRKLVINDYFQPTKKRSQCCMVKDQKSSDVLAPVASHNLRNVKLNTEKASSILEVVKKSSKSQYNKSMKSRPSCVQQRRRQKKSKSLEKVTGKRQTTLKF